MSAASRILMVRLMQVDRTGAMTFDTRSIGMGGGATACGTDSGIGGGIGGANVEISGATN